MLAEVRLSSALDALKAEQARRRGVSAERFAKWRQDPVGFVQEALKGFLWSRQQTIAKSVVVNRRTAVKSCHDVGKTALGARIAAWWVSVWPPGEAFVVTLAPTGHQVKALLWRELNRVHSSGNLAGRMNLTEWYINNEIVAFGRSPADTDPTAIQGIHARRVLVIFDEACGIGKALWDAADTLIANDDSRFLAIGNPDDPATEFHDVCKPGSGWNVIQVTAFDSPNFTGEEIPDWLKPLLIGHTWVEEKRKSWGVTSPLWLSKVMGEFPKQSADGLIPIDSITEAVNRSLTPEVDAANELGVDVSRFGGDATVIYHRLGPVARRKERSLSRDLMHTAGLVVNAIQATGATRVKIDDIGLGGGVTDRLHELKREGKIASGVEIVGVNVSESPATERVAEIFKNKRAEVNWGLRERFLAGNIDIDGSETELLNQAGMIKYRLTSSGLIQMEAKADMKKRTKGVSPDDWDALVLAFAEPSFAGSGMLEVMRQQSVNGKKSKLPPEKVSLRAPDGISTAFGLSGAMYTVVDGLVSVHPDDVPGMKAGGFRAE